MAASAVEVKEPTAINAALWPERYDMLDGWRGLAALMVVASHLGKVPDWMGPPTVMLFFVISGYCITTSASLCLKNGLSFRQFMWRRVRRIYPPYFFSLLYFIATRGIKAASGGTNQLARTPLVWLQNLTLTQWLSELTHPAHSAAGNPVALVTVYWSLNYEEQFYLLMGLMLLAAPLLKVSMRWFVLGLMAIALAWNWCFPSLCYGLFIDFWAHFAVGAILFYRLCRIQSRTVRRAIDLCLIALAVGCGIAAWQTGWANNKWQRNVYLELCVVASFALLLIVLRPMSAWYKQASLGKWLSRLGLISYSLYLIHECNLNLVQSAVSRVVPARFTIANQSLQLAGHIALALVFWYFCERPFLNKRLRKPQVGVSDIAAPAVEGNMTVREVLT